MRNVILSLALLLSATMVFAQSTPRVVDDVFIPKTNSAGTVMITRTGATTLDDTTKPVSVRDWSTVILTLQGTANDTCNYLVQYQPSFDGVTFAALVTIDSLVFSTSGGLPQKSFLLPQSAMGFQSVRFRVSGQAHGSYAGSPTPKVTTRIVRKHN